MINSISGPDRVDHDPGRRPDSPTFELPHPLAGFYLVSGVMAVILVVAAMVLFHAPSADRIDTAQEPYQWREAPTNETRTPPIPHRPIAPRATPQE